MRIAVYGASGYQGKLVAAELRRRDIEMVLAGRSAARLRDAAAAVGAADVELRLAGTGDGDGDALVAAFRGSDAVINCAGPFTRSGEAVVRAAVAAGCHYLDTAGEQLYIKRVFDTCAAAAERAGVTVIPAMTDGGVPGDLVAHLLADRVAPVDALTTAHKVSAGGWPSRGSLRSMLETIETLKDGGLSYADGDWHAGIPARRASMTFPGSSEATPMVKFPLQEVVTVPRHVRARRVESVAEAALAARLSTAVPPERIDELPEGPSEDARRAQRFVIVVDAVGEDGRSARGVVRGSDTYGTTAVIAVEGARRLVTDGAAPGVLAPAQAFDPAGFLAALAPHGVHWTVEAQEAPV